MLDVGDLYARHWSDIRGYVVLRLNTPDDDRIDDLCADIWAKVWERRDQYQDRGLAPKSWLFMIAHNAIIDEYRRANARKRHARIVPLDMLDAWRATVDAGTDRHVDMLVVRDAVAAIPQARLISEYQLQGRIDREAGAVLGISPGAVRKASRRAFVNLRMLLGESA